MSNNEHTAADTVRLASQLLAWLDRIGAGETGAAVDLADIVTAGWNAEKLIRHILTLDPLNPADVDEGRDTLGELHAWLFTEMRWHLDELEKSFEMIEHRLSAFAPQNLNGDGDDGDEPAAP